MLSLPSRTRVYLCTVAVDLRKSFDGLCGLVESVFQRRSRRALVPVPEQTS